MFGAIDDAERAALMQVRADMREALKLADAALSGANMNMKVMEKGGVIERVMKDGYIGYVPKGKM